MLLIDSVNNKSHFDEKKEYKLYKGIIPKYSLDQLNNSIIQTNKLPIQIEFDAELKANFIKKFGYSIDFDLSCKNISKLKIDFEYLTNIVKKNWSGKNNDVFERYLGMYSNSVKNLFSDENESIFYDLFLSENTSNSNDMLKYEYWDFNLFVFELNKKSKIPNLIESEPNLDKLKIKIIQTKNYRSDVVIQILANDMLQTTFFIDYNYTIYQIDKYIVDQGLKNIFVYNNLEYIYSEKTNVIITKYILFSIFLIEYYEDIVYKSTLSFPDDFFLILPDYIHKHMRDFF